MPGQIDILRALQRNPHNTMGEVSKLVYKGPQPSAAFFKSLQKSMAQQVNYQDINPFVHDENTHRLDVGMDSPEVEQQNQPGSTFNVTPVPKPGNRPLLEVIMAERLGLEPPHSAATLAGKFSATIQPVPGAPMDPTRAPTPQPGATVNPEDTGFSGAPTPSPFGSR